MFRCPKCHTELPADARFCNKCGFNHTNAMKAVSPQQAGSPPRGAAQSPSGAPAGQGLTRGYQGNQPPQQPGPMPPHTPQGRPPIQQNPGIPPQPIPGGQIRQSEQIVRTSTPPPPRTYSGGQVPRGPQGPMPFGPQGGSQPAPAAYPPSSLSVESLTATTQAAEHWRNSWRDRQRAEAGPAVGVSRGQAVVPEPLMAMQQSLMRMRSIIMPNKRDAEAGTGQKQIYRISIVLLLCFILGLGTYLISSFIPHTLAAPALVKGVYGVLPIISVSQSAKNPVPVGKPGQTLLVHGDDFAINSTISFSLDTTAINTTVQTNKSGSFDAKVSIPSTQLPGNYTLIAQDKGTGQQATMRVDVLPNGAANNTPLTLTNANGQPAQSLSFTTVNGYDPQSQVLTITNTGATKVTWSATIATTNAQNWITLNASKTADTNYGEVGGAIAPGGTDTVAVNVSAMGLPSLLKKAYQGYVIFNVDQNQLILPVSFSVQNKSLDIAVTPNPLNVISTGSGQCQPTTLGIINNSDVNITWNASTDNATTIQMDVKTGQLDPSGGAGDAVTIHITCPGGIQGGQDQNTAVNNIHVFYNGQQVLVPVFARPN
jgi:hypothetical protein